MVEEVGITEKRKYFPGYLDWAFDCDSEGMGVQLHALADFATGRELTEKARRSLLGFTSNYLKSIYVYGWMDPEGGYDNPFALSPYSEAHLRLLDTVFKSDFVKGDLTNKAEILRLATYKLGAMLTLTEQLTFDAKALGVPVPPTYRPNDPSGKWLATWQKLFGESMPDLQGLYRQAHTVFTANASREDPLLAHLFTIETLPHLK